jgi:hypothetical protein
MARYARILLLFLSLVVGCSYTDKTGTRHTVIVGLGWVSIPQTNQALATVVRMHSIGVAVSDVTGVKLGIGYASGTTVVVVTNSNVIVEVDKSPGAPVKVTVH